jgi:hypothetical protein
MSFASELRAKARATAEPTVERRAAPGPRRPHTAISALPLFAPALALWGAACGALCIMVLSTSAVMTLAAMLLPEFALQFARPVLALGVAALAGMMCYAFARRLSHRRRPAHGLEDVKPIDPVSELGSDSFDAPLPALPAHEEMIWQEEEAAVTLQPSGDDLSLEEFAALPGRNAVWVEEASEPEPDIVVRGVSAPASPARAVPTAIAKLRAAPLAELSLCHMVERFAAALQDHQSSQEQHGDHDREEREAVLNEALKALAQVTRSGMAEKHPFAIEDEDASTKRCV